MANRMSPEFTNGSYAGPEDQGNARDYKFHRTQAIFQSTIRMAEKVRSVTGNPVACGEVVAAASINFLEATVEDLAGDFMEAIDEIRIKRNG